MVSNAGISIECSELQYCICNTHISSYKMNLKTNTNMCISTSWYKMVDWDFILSMA